MSTLSGFEYTHTHDQETPESGLSQPNAEVPLSKELSLSLKDSFKKRMKMLYSFLESWKPETFCTSFEPVSSLTVSIVAFSGAPDLPTPLPEETLEELMQEFPGGWENEDVTPIDETLLKSYAIESGILGGRFIIYAAPYNVDRYWRTLLEELIWTEDVYTVKVSYELRPEAKMPVHIINIHIPDIFDLGTRRKIRMALKRIGIVKLVPLKPDIYDFLGISSKNNLGLRSSVSFGEDALFIIPEISAGEQLFRSHMIMQCKTELVQEALKDSSFQSTKAESDEETRLEVTV